MSEDSKKVDDISELFQLMQLKRLEIGAALFNPSRSTYPLQNAKRVAALAGDLIGMAAQFDRLLFEKYGA